MFPLFLLLLLLHVLSCINITEASHVSENVFNNETRYSCLWKERQALLAFKSSLVGNASSFSSWSHKDCCHWWEGVECNPETGHVIELYTTAFERVEGLTGNISSLFELTELEYLDLNGIDFGYMPKPEFFASFTKLRILRLYNCNLSGTIPSQLGNLSNLKELDLSSNLLHGMIPQSFGNLSKLEELDLSSNLLYGMIPQSLGNLCNLKTLFLRRNRLTGNLSIVDNLSRCAHTNTRLVQLSLSTNQLNGSITKNLGKLFFLEHLDLSSNNLSGVVSEAHLSPLFRLTFLDLSLNHLNIQISPAWHPGFQLEYLHLKSCNLGTRFPQWISNQNTVLFLDISNTGISDSIPSWFWVFRSKRWTPDLASLNLSGNKINGTLSFLCQLNNTYLTFLDVSNNLLTGEIPDCLGTQSELVVLNLAHNTLSGKIPSSMGSLSKLETLYLYNNSFSGELPKSLSSCMRLGFFDVALNKFTGNVPSWIGKNMSRLYILSLRSNKFFGAIPSNLCGLTTLQVLDLSLNNLSGTIPPCLNNISAMVQQGIQESNHKYSFGEEGVFDTLSYIGVTYTDYSVIEWLGTEREFTNNLKFLKSIDLSSNNLTGEIPDEITQLSELVALNLSRNALQGKVPQHIGRLKSLVSLDLSRNTLSDKIPTSLSDIAFLGHLDLSYNKFSGRIPTGTQLQGFNASCYIGNVGLCGPPLTSNCSHGEPPPLDNEDSEEGNDEYQKSLYIGMAAGFITGFWGICGFLLLNRRTRHAFFHLVDDLNDWCYVKIAVMLARQ